MDAASEQDPLGSAAEEPDPAPPDSDEESQDHLAEIDEAINSEPTFGTDDFDPRSDVHEHVFALDDSLTTDGGDTTSDHDGLHDLGDVGDLLGDIGDLLA